MAELNLLEAIGKFKKRAQETVRKFIDEVPFSLDYQRIVDSSIFSVNNLMIKIDFDKSLNQEFLSNI